MGLRKGEESAYKELVNQFQDKVFNTALGLIQHHTEAEDIAQEVFIQVFRSILQFKGDSLLSTWIYRITVTKSLGHLRSKKRKKRFGFLSSLFGENNMPLHEPKDFNHPGVLQENQEDAPLLPVQNSAVFGPARGAHAGAESRLRVRAESAALRARPLQGLLGQRAV